MPCAAGRHTAWEPASLNHVIGNWPTYFLLPSGSPLQTEALHVLFPHPRSEPRGWDVVSVQDNLAAFPAMPVQLCK